MSNTVSVYPNSIDDHLRIPLSPTQARLSEAESPDDYGTPLAKNENSHSDLHHAENNSIKQIEQHSIPDDSISSHDHSDPWDVDYSLDAYRLHPSRKKGRKLRIQNTHVFTDNSVASVAQASRPDSDATGIHHSVGLDDNLGNYQAVSGSLWRKKHLHEVPDSFFEQTNTLVSKWDTTIVQYPGDSIVKIIVALLDEIKKLKAVDDANKADADNKFRIVNRTLGDLVNKIWGGATINADGSINWGKGQNMRIPMADLNFFSASDPNNNTTANAIRSRDLQNNDVRSK